MAFSVANAPLKVCKPQGARARSSRAVVRVACSSEKQSEVSFNRRDAFVAAGGLIATSSLIAPEASLAKLEITLKKENLSAPQIKELRQAMQKRAEQNLAMVLTYQDNADALRLLINDAGTYDIVTKTGGLNGSIILEEELNRPENVALKPYVAKLKQGKDVIDKESIEAGQGPISWTDVIVLGAKVTTQLKWLEAKKKTTGGDESSAMILSTAFGTAFPITIGRADATEPSPAGRIPQPDASVDEIAEFFRRLGNRNPDQERGYLTPRPPFWERPAFLLYTAACADPAAVEEDWTKADPEKFQTWKAKYDKSRRTVTRTDYEVDFVEFFTRLANLGTTFDKLAYLKDLSLSVKT
ncbi:hypothetical protein BSKO_08951 [Bryopsis sp. KO-2023]|nr:hypothetical protein BSKO_08951 [Bryopsis sp. KO-2023]